MHVLVTGGAGFIGSNLVDRLLAEGHHVDVIDDLSSGSLANLAEARRLPGAFTFHQLDIREPEVVDLIARRAPQVVYHLAAQSSVPISVAHPVDDAEVNVLGSLNVFEGARAAKSRKVVFAASGGSLYGQLSAEDLPVSELAPYRPTTPYGLSKKVVLDYLAIYRELYSLEFSALALANVYGPRQRAGAEGGVVASFVENLLARRACTVYEDGRQTRDFVFVDDVVDAFSRASERGSGLVLNIGTGAETSIIDLYSLVARLIGSERKPRFAKGRPLEVSRSCLDATRAGIHLGWKPWTSVEDGVSSVISSMTTRPRAAVR